MSETLEAEKLEPEKLDLASLDIAEEKRAELLRLFPEVRTEGGKIDFDRLRMALGEAVDVGKERYGMNWPGKADCFKAIQRPSLGTLLPVREESVNFDETENLIIEGDNLEVLKLLQKSYQGKVKMIYIDPPYNTGNDFIYPDNYSESLQTYLEYTGQVDSEGKKFSSNTEEDGRFHSKWLGMMYPRLYLALNLLREDGAIFVSCDEMEQPRLRALMDEIYGQENFVADMVWAAGRKNDSRLISVSHEYIVCYARNSAFLTEQKIEWRQRKKGLLDIYAKYQQLKAEFGSNYDAMTAGLKEWYRGLVDNHPAKAHRHYCNVDRRGVYFAADISWPGGGGPKYVVLHPLTKKPVKIPARGWTTPDPEKMRAWIADDRVQFGENEDSVPCLKKYLRDSELQTPYSVFYQDGRAATKRLRELMGGDYFGFPKDEAILQDIIGMMTSGDDLIIDFFAGSGTTAHAAINQDEADGGNRKFILVQLPEPTGRDDYKTIADITKERVRRVIQRHNKEAEGKLDLGNRPKEGFRVLKLASSNFSVWNATTETTTPDGLGQQLALHVDHVKRGRSEEDLLCEILLKSGFPLTTPVEKLTLEGKTVYSVSDGAMLICLDKQLTHGAIKAMAERKPERVVCLDEGFAGNDQLKTNAVLIMKSKGVTKFQTI